MGLTQEATPAAIWRSLRETSVPMSGLDRAPVPTKPGILVLYRDERMVWFGKSANLRGTTVNALAVQGPSANSALRRTVSTFLGFATLEALAAGRYRLTPDDHTRISGWIRECGVAWHECDSETDVIKLEARLFADPDPKR